MKPDNDRFDFLETLFNYCVHIALDWLRKNGKQCCIDFYGGLKNDRDVSIIGTKLFLADIIKGWFELKDVCRTTYFGFGLTRKFVGDIISFSEMTSAQKTEVIRRYSALLLSLYDEPRVLICEPGRVQIAGTARGTSIVKGTLSIKKSSL